jgi:hypothetical protein
MAKKTVKVTNGKVEIEVSEKAFEVVYQGHGYKIVEEKKKKKDDK